MMVAPHEPVAGSGVAPVVGAAKVARAAAAGWKRHPCGKPAIDGTTPAISCSCAGRPARARRAAAASRQAAACRDGSAPEDRSAARVSTIRPAYITPTRRHDVGDQAEIVADHQDGGAPGGAELAHQVDDLGLHRDVERRGRLVGEQQIGLQASAMAIITRCRMPPESWCG
jgi:hypothetical protein